MKSVPLVHYTISLPQPQQHILEVAITIKGLTDDRTLLRMPAWTPGSYLLRDYARHVRSFRAYTDDQPCSWRKIDRLTWDIDTANHAEITVQYQVYGHELTVRTNHVDDTHAHIIPAATFMYVPEHNEPAWVTLNIPENWRIATGLDPIADQPNTFVARDLDELMDCPIEAGIHQRYDWTIDDKRHSLVIWGNGNEDPARLVADTTKIVEAQRDFWGGLPYQHYTFFLLLAGSSAGGGLEHRNSTSLLLPRHTFKPARAYERFLSLTSHEFFHTWNVKRLRSEVLGPFDYTQENYTRLLWVMEGFTEYYTDLFLVRAGLLTPQRYLERLADDITTLQTTAGRKLHSLSASSFDTWIKFYRPDESTPNTTISYYLKGAMAALVLDMTLRERSNGTVSLDDLMRYLYQTYPFESAGIPEVNGIRDALNAILPGEWDEFFSRYIDGVEELPFDHALHTVGIDLKWDYVNKSETGQPQAKLGIRTKTVDGRIHVTHVLDGGSAAAAGIAPLDEIIALDNNLITESTLEKRLADYAIGATVELTFFRHEMLKTLPVKLLEVMPDQAHLVAVEQPSNEQRTNTHSWLGADLWKQ